MNQLQKAAFITIALALAALIFVLAACCLTKCTPQENLDFCTGQLTLCSSRCNQTTPGDPCLKNCQDDYTACMRLTTCPQEPNP